MHSAQNTQFGGSIGALRSHAYTDGLQVARVVILGYAESVADAVPRRQTARAHGGIPREWYEDAVKALGAKAA